MSAALQIAARAGIAAIIGALLGIIAQNNRTQWARFDPGELNWTVVAAVCGALLTLLLYLAWEWRRRPATIIYAAIFFVFANLLMVGPLHTLLTLLFVALVLFASTIPLRNLYGLSPRQTFLYHMRVCLATRSSPVVIDNGRIVVPSGAGPFLGPCQVVIRPGNAAILTSGGAISRICGPSMFMCRNFEFVSRVLPLTMRRHNLAVPNALTSDQLPVDVRLSFVYSLRTSEATNAGLNAGLELPDGSRGLTQREHDRLGRMVSLSPDWEQDIRVIIEGAVHNEISRYNYGQVLSSIDYQQIALEVRDLAAVRIRQLGAQLQSIAVASVVPRLEAIDVITDNQRIQTQRTAEALGFSAAITTAAAAYRQARSLGMTPDEIRREVTREAMENMAGDPAAKIVVPLT